MYQAFRYATSIPWTGAPAIRVYQTNDDMGSNRSFIKSVWENRPEWFLETMKTDVKLGQRVYAWHVMSDDQAKILADIGVRWIYMGVDGKEGFTPHPSARHPLIQTLENCRRHGLVLNLGFVLGLYGQTWDSIYDWLRFRHWLVQHYADVIAYINGWVHVVAPGSPDWDRLSLVEPHLVESDLGDDSYFLEKARAMFFGKCTQLCSSGMTADRVRSRLYDLALEFEFERNKQSRIPHSFMLEP